MKKGTGVYSLNRVVFHKIKSLNMKKVEKLRIFPVLTNMYISHFFLQNQMYIPILRVPGLIHQKVKMEALL